MSKTVKLYKVLKRGHSCHGGKLKWSLPKNGKPGKWMEIDTKKEGQIDPCYVGLHLTTQPARWYSFGCNMSIYLVEVHKKSIRRWEKFHNCWTLSWSKTDKIAVSKCRLVRKLSKKECLALGCP